MQYYVELYDISIYCSDVYQCQVNFIRFIWMPCNDIMLSVQVSEYVFSLNLEHTDCFYNYCLHIERDKKYICHQGLLLFSCACVQ